MSSEKGSYSHISTMLGILAGLAAVSPRPVQAQAATAVAPEGQLEEIVVSARKRDERLQDIPESVTAFTAKDIEHAGIRSFRDVADLTPNLSELDNYRPGLARIQIRGLITPQVGDSPLAFVVDGVTLPDAEFINQDLVDIERIEILRGAEGALYGRGAVGGAVNIVTKQPTNEFAGNVQASYGNGAAWRLAGAVSGPLIQDKLKFRLGGFYKSSSGLIDNVFLHQTADMDEESSVFGLLKAELDDATTVDVRAHYGRSRNGLGYYQAVAPVTIEDFSIATSQNVPGIDKRRIFEANVKLERRMPFATLVAALGYNRSNDDAFSDYDYTAVPTDFVLHYAGGQDNLIKINAFTFEGRLTSAGAGRFRWALGSFYQTRTRETAFYVYDDAIGNVPRPRSSFSATDLVDASTILDHNTSDAWALSGQANYDLTPDFELTAALRYDHDKRRSYDQRDIPTTLATTPYAELQPKLSLSYKVAPDVLVYGGYARGFRSGGFNEYSPFTSRIFGKEVTDSYELGFKSTLLEHRLTLNGAFFLLNQDNAQITRFNVSSFTLENLAIDRVQSKGFEFEIAATPMAGLELRLSGGTTDSKIEAFTADPGSVGSPMPHVPKYTANFSVDYSRPVNADLNALLRIDFRQNGRRIFDLSIPDVAASPHHFVDARVGLEGKSWNLSLYGQNLLNERQPEDVFAFGDGVVDLARQPNKPRHYGVEARLNF